MIFELSRENEIKKAFKCHVLCTRPPKHSEVKQRFGFCVNS